MSYINTKCTETYTYTNNQPKNVTSIKVEPMTESIPYNYSYNYALYKPPKRQEQPTQKEQKLWKGVV